MDETGVLGLLEELSILLEDSKPVFGKGNMRQVDIAAAFEIMDEIRDFAGPLAWQADISNTGDALLVTGTVEGEAKTACARCLDEVSFPVTGEIEGYFLLDETKAAPEDMDEDEFDVLPADKVIDLEPLITAALLLEFPLIPLCDEECKGLCPQCGANLNEGPCGCEPAADDDDDMPPNPFAALKDFPFDEPQN